MGAAVALASQGRALGEAASMMAVYGDSDVMRYIPGGPLPDVDAVRAIMEEQIVGISWRKITMSSFRRKGMKTGTVPE